MKHPHLKPVQVDAQRQVKCWISRDGLPTKHQARFIRFRAMNPQAKLSLIVADKYLTETARIKLHQFAKRINMEIIDYYEIPAKDAIEADIKRCLDREIKFFFEQEAVALKGNLSVVSDQLRLFSHVINLGMMTDCDVEFETPLPIHPVYAPLGFIARQKEKGTRVSNDLTAGNPHNPVFVAARCLVHQHNATYHRCVARYFKEQGIEFDEQDYAHHPHYYEARNQQIKQFSLGGGPQLFAVALHRCGIATGYEDKYEEIGILGEDLRFTPYQLQKIESDTATDFAAMFPPQMGFVISHWDTSWMPEETHWRLLTPYQTILLQLAERGEAVNGELLNKAWAIQQFTLMTLSAPFPTLATWLAHFYQPAILGRRDTPYDKLPVTTQQYIQRNETPNPKIRQSLQQELGPEFTKMAEKLDQDGVLVLPGFVEGDDLSELQQRYAEEVAKKEMHPRFKQTSFSIAAESVDDRFTSSALRVGHNLQLQALVRHHFGQDSKWTAMRGYRQWPLSPCRYRAWDWHHDNKTQGPYGEIKIMVIVSGVSKDGQAMRYMHGAHQFHWQSRTLRATKFSMEEAQQYTTRGSSICYGPPGTVVIFDTNGIHSGWRNLADSRDVITLTYTPNTGETPEMFQVPESEKNREYRYTATQRLWANTITHDDTLNATALQKLIDTYHATPTLSEVKSRFNTKMRSFADFLVQVACEDLNDDLDLEVREQGNTVIRRDNQLVKFRDASPSHFQYQRLRQRLHQQPPNIGYAVSIPVLMDFAKQAADYESQPYEFTPDIRDCANFARDLAEAFSRIDSIQRLRTQITYLYFTLDRMTDQMQRIGAMKTVETHLDQMANRVLEMYANIVYIDDLNNKNIAFKCACW